MLVRQRIAKLEPRKPIKSMDEKSSKAKKQTTKVEKEFKLFRQPALNTSAFD
jgi:hypothetical protein